VLYGTLPMYSVSSLERGFTTTEVSWPPAGRGFSAGGAGFPDGSGGIIPSGPPGPDAGSHARKGSRRKRAVFMARSVPVSGLFSCRVFSVTPPDTVARKTQKYAGKSLTHRGSDVSGCMI